MSELRAAMSSLHLVWNEQGLYVCMKRAQRGPDSVLRTGPWRLEQACQSIEADPESHAQLRWASEQDQGRVYMTISAAGLGGQACQSLV